MSYNQSPNQYPLSAPPLSTISSSQTMSHIPIFQRVLRAYSIKYRKINWEEPQSVDLFPNYIRSFGWIPNEAEFVRQGAYDIISTLAKLGKIEEALEAARGIGMISGASTGGSKSVDGEMD